MSLVAWPASNANSYITASNAAAYFDDALYADAWDAATDAHKDKSLVTATRMLDRQSWQGEKTDPAQPLQFPRTGLTYLDGTEVPSDALPQALLNATCELALALLGDSSVQTNTDTSSNIQNVTAGPASVTFFKPTSGSRFPTIVQELVGLFLQSAIGSGTATPYVSGTCERSTFDDDMSLTEPYY